MNKAPFSALDLPPAFLANLDSLGYQNMTPIQAKSLPIVLDGHDLIAQAKTGSGKTAAFGIGILSHVNPKFFGIQALVLCPTRELADQVAKELRRLARHIENIKILSLCGGSPMGPQIGSLEHGAHIVVGTPGRIRDHLGRGTIILNTISTLVLDEADRMVDMGFYDDIAGIVSACPKRRQTLMFSATYPDTIRKESARFLKSPVEIRVESLHDSGQIEQRFYEVVHEERNAAVALVLDHFRPKSALVFCNTKIHCRELAAMLQEQGFAALALYGDLEQRDRDEILIRFANRSCSVLVATDVAARGLDISTLDVVINVDVSRDTEVHIHRIGRTGRGEDCGLAVSLASAAEKKWVKLIEEYQNAPAQWFGLDTLTPGTEPREPAMVTLCISGGKKEKLRPGDILGAFTGEGGLAGSDIGKINITEFISYVALNQRIAHKALKRLADCNIKGKRYKMRLIGG
ncbi:ATP-dependent RNA helicase DbpA [Andreprevotia sp. IGB-42]|uniref:ATP-dependent RNA helicase DbpA n=1 Tax=Andreprevotia sp. IGB-42 TaxID=2497473 RepID=UPI001358CDF7|nr:ATP-dependent RNA helicase DbpA [Andreprevotia sp. IGB-42]KAF0811622.1 ATP-dependent RNA helicase DbpA [Andreprevotia sp. IGB-42]